MLFLELVSHLSEFPEEHHSSISKEPLTLQQQPHPKQPRTQLQGALTQHPRPFSEELILISYTDLLLQEMSISCFHGKPRHAHETHLQSNEKQR